MVSDIYWFKKVYLKGLEAQKLQITTFYLFSSTLEPWILPRDIGSIPVGGAETMWRALTYCQSFPIRTMVAETYWFGKVLLVL